MKPKMVNLVKEKIIKTDFMGFFEIKLLKNGNLLAKNDSKLILFKKENFNYEIVIEEKDEDNKDITIDDFISINNNSFCYSINNDLKIIQLTQNNEYKIIQILKGHNNIIRKILVFKDNILISCSMDKTIKIWELDILNNKYQLKNSTIMNDYEIDEDFNNIILLNEKILLYYSNNYGEGTIKFLNLNTNKIIKTINDIKCETFDDSIIVYNNLLIICGESNNNLYLIDLFNYQIVKTFEFISPVGLLKLNNGNILIIEKSDIFRDEYILVEYGIQEPHNLVQLRTSQRFNFIYNLLELQENRLLTIDENNNIVIWKNPFVEKVIFQQKTKKKEKEKKLVHSNTKDIKNNFSLFKKYFFYIFCLNILILTYIIYIYIY